MEKQERQNCTAIPTSNDVSWKCREEDGSGTTCTATCPQGTTLKGSLTQTTCVDGTWSPLPNTFVCLDETIDEGEKKRSMPVVSALVVVIVLLLLCLSVLSVLYFRRRRGQTTTGERREAPVTATSGQSENPLFDYYVNMDNNSGYYAN